MSNPRRGGERGKGGGSRGEMGRRSKKNRLTLQKYRLKFGPVGGQLWGGNQGEMGGGNQGNWEGNQGETGVKALRHQKRQINTKKTD